MTTWGTGEKVRDLYGRGGRRSQSAARQGRRTVRRERQAAFGRRERRQLLQLVLCGGIFIFMVAAKLLLPGKLDGVGRRLNGVLSQNIDVAEVFSAVGRGISGDLPWEHTWDEVYKAVFKPDEETAVPVSVTEREDLAQPNPVSDLRRFADGNAACDIWLGAETAPERKADDAQDPEPAAETSYIFYSDENLPAHVSMSQAILNFRYCTPLQGTLSSKFGYREHPVQGDERFHYGIDIAADNGSEVDCFADGTVSAVGESSSYGKYVTVAHGDAYTTLYAHCSKITVSSGASVRRGQKIAEVGETGIATGPHLHFELHHGSDYLNPVYYVSFL